MGIEFPGHEGAGFAAAFACMFLPNDLFAAELCVGECRSWYDIEPRFEFGAVLKKKPFLFVEQEAFGEAYEADTWGFVDGFSGPMESFAVGMKAIGYNGSLACSDVKWFGGLGEKQRRWCADGAADERARCGVAGGIEICGEVFATDAGEPLTLVHGEQFDLAGSGELSVFYAAECKTCGSVDVGQDDLIRRAWFDKPHVDFVGIACAHMKRLESSASFQGFASVFWQTVKGGAGLPFGRIREFFRFCRPSVGAWSGEGIEFRPFARGWAFQRRGRFFECIGRIEISGSGGFGSTKPIVIRGAWSR